MRYSISFKYMRLPTHFWEMALISYGVKLFGMTPFGWRVIDVICWSINYYLHSTI